MHSIPKQELYSYGLKRPKTTPLDTDIEVDIAIIGGGITGLICAERLKRENKNLKIAVLEADFCGAGSSGTSAGFVGIDPELRLSTLIELYGEERAKALYDFSLGGMNILQEIIERKNLPCDFHIQDTLFVAADKDDYGTVSAEYLMHKKLGYPATIYPEQKVQEVLGSSSYRGVARMKGSFGIQSYLFCQEFKESVWRDSVPVYEETRVVEITAPYVKTEHHIIHAEKIIVCTDTVIPRLADHTESMQILHTTVAVSKPISREVINELFPRKAMQVCDTNNPYYFYRMIEGDRVLVGTTMGHYPYITEKKSVSKKAVQKLYNYLNATFPYLMIDLEYVWNEWSVVSKDFLPIVGKDPSMKNVYTVQAASGLAMKAALGHYIADRILYGKDEFDDIFKPGRRFPRKPFVEKIAKVIKKLFT